MSFSYWHKNNNKVKKCKKNLLKERTENDEKSVNHIDLGSGANIKCQSVAHSAINRRKKTKGLQNRPRLASRSRTEIGWTIREIAVKGPAAESLTHRQWWSLLTWTARKPNTMKNGRRFKPQTRKAENAKNHNSHFGGNRFFCLCGGFWAFYGPFLYYLLGAIPYG